MLGLVISTAGAAIPFGFESGGYSYHVTDFEWALTGLFVLSLLGMVLWWRGRGRRWSVNSLLLASATWTTAAVYSGAFDPKQTWRWRVGFTLIFLGVATTALFAFVGETRGAP